MGSARLLALAALVTASCGVLSVAPSAPPPSPSLPPGDIGFGRFLDSRDFTVMFTSFSADGAIAAERLAKDLPSSWERATGGASRVRVVDGEADIQIVVVVAAGNSTGGGRLITLRVSRAVVGDLEMFVMLHELGHALGCCFGQDADSGGHWTTCGPGGEIMCSGGPRTLRFSERELRVLRLR